MNIKNLIIQEKQQQLLLYEQQFSDFWNSYRPVSVNGEFVAKGSKKLAKEKFFKILRKGEDYENIKRGLIEYPLCRQIYHKILSTRNYVYG